MVICLPVKLWLYSSTNRVTVQISPCRLLFNPLTTEKSRRLGMRRWDSRQSGEAGWSNSPFLYSIVVYTLNTKLYQHVYKVQLFRFIPMQSIFILYIFCFTFCGEGYTYSSRCCAEQKQDGSAKICMFLPNYVLTMIFGWIVS